MEIKDKSNGFDRWLDAFQKEYGTQPQNIIKILQDAYTGGFLSAHAYMISHASSYAQLLGTLARTCIEALEKQKRMFQDFVDLASSKGVTVDINKNINEN